MTTASKKHGDELLSKVMDLIRERLATNADAPVFRVPYKQAVSPRYDLQIMSGVLPEVWAGSFLTMFVNNSLSTFAGSPLGTTLERDLIRRLLRFLPWDQAKAGGTSTPAGSFSNYDAVFLACSALLRAGIERKRCVVYTSEVAHYSIERACKRNGIRVSPTQVVTSSDSFEQMVERIGKPNNCLVRIQANEQDQMCPDVLAAAIKATLAAGKVPAFVNATVGTTVAGMIDPVEKIAQVIAMHRPSQELRIWLHVDAAHGFPGMCGAQRDVFLSGIQHVDSVTVDLHKASLAPMTLSYLLVRDASALDANMTEHAKYLFVNKKDRAKDLGINSSYCGKPWKSLGAWWFLRVRGEAGMAQHVDRAQRLAKLLVQQLRSQIGASRIEIGMNGQSQTWMTAFRPAAAAAAATLQQGNAITTAFRDALDASGKWYVKLVPYTRSGELFCSTVWINPLKTEAIVAELVQDIDEALRSLPRSNSTDSVASMKAGASTASSSVSSMSTSTVPGLSPLVADLLDQAGSAQVGGNTSSAKTLVARAKDLASAEERGAVIERALEILLM